MLAFFTVVYMGGEEFGEQYDALSEKYTEKANIPYE